MISDLGVRKTVGIAKPKELYEKPGKCFEFCKTWAKCKRLCQDPEQQDRCPVDDNKIQWQEVDKNSFPCK